MKKNNKDDRFMSPLLISSKRLDSKLFANSNDN